MFAPLTVLAYAYLRPFRLHVASGRVFEVAEPDRIKVLKTQVLAFEAPVGGSEFPEWYDRISFSHLDMISFTEHTEDS